MSQLTKTAKKTLCGLLIGTLLIVFGLLQLGQYYAQSQTFISAKTLRSLTRLVNQLQKSPQANWPSILQNYPVYWSEITLSPSPTYEQNALLTLKAPILFNLIKHHKKLEFSLFIQEGTWLNVSMISPTSNQLSWILSVFLILLAALIFINYWAVKILNQPIQTLIQSLNYNENQESWLPIPITGNPDQKVILKKINELQGKLNKLLANRTRVVTAISHDLRTPLTRLKLRAEALIDSPYYSKINADIYEMEFMIEETLDYFRDLNQAEKPQRFDLVALLSSLRDDALELNYEVQLISEYDKLIYFGCVNLFKRAFNNLIHNAVQYGVNALIHLQQRPHQIEISIVDQGPGLTDTDLEHVFLPFYRGENSRSRSTGGTGLGLTIAREIMQMHQGDLTLSNRLEGGLNVLVTLPVKPWQ